MLSETQISARTTHAKRYHTYIFTFNSIKGFIEKIYKKMIRLGGSLYCINVRLGDLTENRTPIAGMRIPCPNR